MRVQIHEKLNQLHSWFSSRGQTLAFAESCTGGLMSSLLTERSGVSAYFLGAVVSYHRNVKENTLHVPKSTLQCLGEVSIPTAKYMAEGVREQLGADWAVSVTGIAGPSGGTKEKPVGTVCFAVVGPGYHQTVIKSFSKKDRNQIQLESAHFAFELLLNAIN